METALQAYSIRLPLQTICMAYTIEYAPRTDERIQVGVLVFKLIVTERRPLSMHWNT